jgi:hypothetical protein
MSSEHPLITLSIVSHKQLDLVGLLLSDFQKYASKSNFEVVITLNTTDETIDNLSGFSFPTTIIKNKTQLGFGQNHNNAFEISHGDYFCVINPDIRIEKDPFPALIESLHQDKTIGVVSPIVTDENDHVEDHARTFPSFLGLISKIFKKPANKVFFVSDGLSYPDWTAGMFMFFPREVFDSAAGFDTRYFLYYEDVDICCRLYLAGYKIACCHQTKVIHNARRESHRSSKFFKWHISSIFRFLTSRTRFLMLLKRLGVD